MTDRGEGVGVAVHDLTGSGVTPTAEREDRERVRRIAAEADLAFRRMAAVRRGVSIFGSAQEGPALRWGTLAREVSGALADAGFAVITGGGPGLMAAANEGAQRASGISVGLTIQLAAQEEPNRFLTLEVPFHYFFLRKLAFVRYACAFVLLPGGYGTLDELFEALNLRRTHRLDPFPVILMGSEYWGGLLEWLETAAVDGGTLSKEDVSALEVTDDPAEVVRQVVECHATLCRKLGIAP